MADEFEEWMLAVQTDLAQVIAARASLRVVPLALDSVAPEDWFDAFAIAVFRAAAVTWILRQTVNDQGRRELSQPGASAAADAALVVRAGARAADHLKGPVATAADCIANATDAARADAYSKFAARASWAAAVDACRFEGIDESIGRDRDWLTRHKAPSRTLEELSERLARERLWLVPEWVRKLRNPPRPQSIVPNWFSESWESAQVRLDARNENYSVWIDWYDRVIRGKHPSFGSTRETEEHVFSRLLGADRQFWQQPATIINRTILAWIDELELENRLAALVDRVRAASAQHRSSLEASARVSLIAELEELAQIEIPVAATIGHNNPPEPVEWQVESAILADLKAEAGAAIELLSVPTPNGAEVGKRITLIGRALRKLASLGGLAANKAAEAFGTAVGAAAGVALVSMIALKWAGLLDSAITWLGSLL